MNTVSKSEIRSYNREEDAMLAALHAAQQIIMGNGQNENGARQPTKDDTF